MASAKLVFIIDDDLIQNEVTALLIDKAFPGITVKTFASCQEAIAALEKGQVPDIIFLDLHMPGENIKQLLDKHKGRNLQSSIYIMSSMPYMDDRSLFKDYPAVKDFINKPLLEHKLKPIFGIQD